MPYASRHRSASRRPAPRPRRPPRGRRRGRGSPNVGAFAHRRYSVGDMQSTCGCSAASSSSRSAAVEPARRAAPSRSPYSSAGNQTLRTDFDQPGAAVHQTRSPSPHAHPPLELEPVRLEVAARVNGRLRAALGAGREDQEGRARRGRARRPAPGRRPSGMSAGCEHHGRAPVSDDALRQLGIRDLLDARQRDGADPVQRAEQAEPLGALRQPHRARRRRRRSRGRGGRPRSGA